MTNEWTPKVGDKVRVVGNPHVSGKATIASGDVDATGWYWVRAPKGALDVTCTVHIRNLDRILEDERKGLPRPPIQDAETVNVVMTAAFRKVCSCGRNVIHVTGGSFKADDPRVKQLERRVQNLGRQARKQD